MVKSLQLLAAQGILGLLVTASPLAAETQNAVDSFSFNMKIAAGAASCLPKAAAQVTITPGGSVDTMDITVQGLPPNTHFGVFVTQVPKAPFGVAWYLGDVATGNNGRGHQHFVGRFSINSFAIGTGSAPAPDVFNGPFPDATLNPPFNPIQMYHLGLWIDSPQSAQTAGCPATVTPFNDEHNAGIQVMNTSNFADDQGPLRHVNP